jgi:hypothetical protein
MSLCVRLAYTYFIACLAWRLKSRLYNIDIPFIVPLDYKRLVTMC